MDDGEMILRCSADQQPSMDDSFDSLINELLQDTNGCTHIHTCNPPGPDNTHTHTCFHVHTTKVASASTDDSVQKKSHRRPLGNREAVRKYRKKTKARTASLENEVLRLKAVNQQLLRRLQLQAVLEAEAARLKCLLVDIRGRIEGEIGSFPHQKSAAHPGASYTSMKIHCDAVPCANVMYCNQDRELLSNVQAFSASDFETLNCFASVANLAPAANSPGVNASQWGGANSEATAD